MPGRAIGKTSMSDTVSRPKKRNPVYPESDERTEDQRDQRVAAQPAFTLQP